MVDDFIVPVCIRCSTAGVQAMLITDATVLWYCPKCAQIWAAPRLQETQALCLLDTLHYLAVESMCLADLARDLSHECSAARSKRPSIEALEARVHATRVYQELVANHLLAVKFMLRSARRRVSAPFPPSVSEPSAA